MTLIRSEIRKGMDEQDLAREYLQAVDGSLVQAQTLMEQANYPAAALLFKSVLDNSPRNPALQQKIAVSPAQLAEKIAICTAKLMDAGLVAYRSGELGAAIDIWQQVLSFNPQHQAAKKSIQTAQLQLSNLKNLEQKN